MHVENLALVAPLIILLPSIGAFINFFWGPRLGERYSAIIGTAMSASTFVVALILLSYLTGNSFQPAIVEPPFLDGWIRIGEFEVTWATRVDTLSVTMMLFVTFVGTLIHLYAAGYMHGDPRFSRFFAYLNMFLAFMLILITGNNFLMMFVGWEGVGLCSYLLIGFWWDKPNGEGWKNSNAARKAFIANRVGDFALLMAMFLIFWSFGTLDFFRPTEVNNADAFERLVSGGSHEGEGAIGEEAGEQESSQIILMVEETTEGAVEGEGAHGEDAAHASVLTSNSHLEFAQLGVFGQAARLVSLDEGEFIETGTGEIQGRMIDFGNFQLDIDTVLFLITLLILIGATGKSAQIPLFVWLPDAMAGPTPVSALIHAATMVTAGVYLMVRSNVFFYYSPVTSFIVTIIGALTAIVAGYIAVGQFDIKRVLAYSTVSQLGFMVAAVGIGAYPAAMFHMITHAFFKALLFLGSGSVIHGVEHGHHHAEHGHGHGHGHDDDHHDAEVQHEDVHGYAPDEMGDHKPGVQHAHAFDPQDMRNMGGLRKKMPITFWTYMIGTLALAGIWPFAGFWSKDEILADAWLVGIVDGELSGFIALGLLLAAAGMTAFYMWRQIEMVFFGKPRTEAAEQASESSWQMTTPLIILAFFSVVIGFLNFPTGAGVFALGLDNVIGKHVLADFMEFSIARFHLPPFQPVIAIGALIIALGAIFLARSIYGNNRALTAEGKDRLEANSNVSDIWGVAHARMYWDEIYERIFIQPFNRISKFLADTLDWNFFHDYFHNNILWKGFNAIARLFSRPLDIGIIDGAVNGVGRLVRGTSGVLRRSQTGYVRVYAIALFLGVVAVIVIMLLPMIQG